LPGLTHITQIVKWIGSTFGREAAGQLLAKNGLRVLVNGVGA
jgi:hypothetical protein